jgi:outer membrane protein assembly factor BamA
MQSNEINRTRYPQRDRIVYGKWDISPYGDWAVDVTASYRHTEAIEDKRIGDDCCNSEERWGVGAGVMYDDRAFGEFSPYGWKVVGSVARVFGSRETDSDYWKYDGSIQKHFNVYRRTRIFHLSVRADGVRRINNKSVPFWDLPILGGEDYLRGFPVDRFRDNVTLVFTAQYRYPIFQRLSGSFFVDFGSAAPEWESFKLQDFRTGYGWQLESHLDDNFIFRLQLAHSREGLQVYVATATSIDLLEKKAVR